MRLLKTCASRAWGGMEMSMVLTATKLRDRGHAVFPVCQPDCPIEENLVAAGFDPLRCDIWGKFHPDKVWQLTRYVRRHGIELIHTDNSRDLFSLVPVRQLTGGVPLVLQKHIGTGDPKNLFVHHYMYRRVDHVIAISEVIRRNLLATHPLREDQVGVVHAGVDMDRFRPDPAVRARVRAELGVPDGACLVGIIGRLQKEKGHFDFIETAQRLQTGHPDTRWVIIGAPTPSWEEEAASIEDAARAAGLGEKLILAGFRRDVPDLLDAMDVFLFPSHAEAYGLVVVEAMAMGVPVVAYGCDGVLDLVVPGETGELVELYDRAGLAAAVDGLLGDGGRRDAQGRAARKLVEERFTEEHMYRQLEDLYAGLIDRHRSDQSI